MLTKPAHALIGLTLGVGLTLWLNPARAEEHTPENTPNKTIHYVETDRDGYSFNIYEDGSGVQYDDDGQEVRTFPEDTFYWDCERMGNGICGPTC